MILHVDMDAFYASIEIRDNPDLAGKPVVVGGSSDRRGVVAAASYAARKYGVFSAMPMITAKRLCPDLLVVPVDIAKYVAVSEQLHAIFARYTPEIEPLALDEAFLDVTASERLFGQADQIAVEIKDCIRAELHLTASVGVASNKFIAKIASDLDKPDGIVVVPQGLEQSFLDPLPISCIWGLGKTSQRFLAKFNIKYIKHLRETEKSWLLREMGKHGLHIWELANGIDTRPVVSERSAKSISHETTFATDQMQNEVLLAVLLDLAESVAQRVRRRGLKFRTVQIKIRLDDFSTYTRARTLAEPSAATDNLWNTAKQLLLEFRQAQKQPIRLLGVGVSEFSDKNNKQIDMFSQGQERNWEKIDRLTDNIRDRFGKDMIKRARAQKETTTPDKSKR